MAAIVTLLVGIMLAVFIADPNALEKDGSKQLNYEDKKKKQQANLYAGIASAIIVVLAWILFPMIGAWSNRNSWHTAQSMLSGYEARGMSPLPMPCARRTRCSGAKHTNGRRCEGAPEARAQAQIRWRTNS
jgi:hypothetical protein